MNPSLTQSPPLPGGRRSAPLLSLGLATGISLLSLIILSFARGPSFSWMTREAAIMASGVALGAAFLTSLIQSFRTRCIGLSLILMVTLGTTSAVVADVPFNSILGLFSDCWCILVVFACLMLSMLGLAREIIAAPTRARGQQCQRPLAWIFALLFPFPMIAWVDVVNDIRREDARAWCEDALTSVANWRTMHGRYPLTLEEAHIHREDGPTRLHRFCPYGSDGTGCGFWIVTDVFGNDAEVRYPGWPWRYYQLGL